MKNLESKISESLIAALEQKFPLFFRAPERRILIISGPTGVGKTALSLKLAELLHGEIVSADSVQVYRGMDIGTAKASKEERAAIPHHMIDVCSITDPFCVMDFYEQAKRACEDILERGKVPIVVGGTGFYMHTLLYGPPEGPPSDKNIRSFFEIEYEKLGIEPLFEKLSSLDPEYAQTITQNDAHKVIRALEIIELSGKPVSSFPWKDKKKTLQFDFRPWFLYMPRKMLYERVERRCDTMLEQGFLNEVVQLDSAGLRENKTASQAIGYKQALAFFDTMMTPKDYKQFVETFKIASRNLVKRQLTWFRKEPLFRWLDLTKHEIDEVLEILIEDFRSVQPLDWKNETEQG